MFQSLGVNFPENAESPSNGYGAMELGLSVSGHFRSAKDQSSKHAGLSGFYGLIFLSISSFFSILVMPPWLKLILMKPVKSFFLILSTVR